MYNRRAIGTLGWSVAPATDVPAPVTGTMRQVGVTLSWTLGAQPDSVNFTRLVAAP